VFHYPGEYLTPGDPAVVELLVIDELVAVFNIPAEEAVDLRIGSPVTVALRSVPQSIHAWLTTISPVIDGESGTVEIRVVLDNRDGTLQAGDRCTLQFRPSNSLPTDQQKQASRDTSSFHSSTGRRQ
jgi:multidrug efflux pump subunit AcrA (membrane-fusion protein)